MTLSDSETATLHALLSRLPLPNSALSQADHYTLQSLIKRDLVRRRIEGNRIVWEGKR